MNTTDAKTNQSLEKIEKLLEMILLELRKSNITKSSQLSETTMENTMKKGY